MAFVPRKESTLRPRLFQISNSETFSNFSPTFLAMSRVVKAFREFLVAEKTFRKIFAKQTPGNRITPPRTNAMDAKLQLRLDAGEVVNGKKAIYLQVNSQAKNEALKRFKKKYGTDANLATAFIDEDTPEEKQEEVFEEMWQHLEPQIRERLG